MTRDLRLVLIVDGEPLELDRAELADDPAVDRLRGSPGPAVDSVPHRNVVGVQAEVPGDHRTNGRNSMSDETDRARRDGFTKGFLACKAITDKAVKDLFSAISGHAFGVQFANETVDGSGLGRSFSKSLTDGIRAEIGRHHEAARNLAEQSLTINHRFTVDDKIVKEIATQIVLDMFGKATEAMSKQPDQSEGSDGPGQ